MNSNLGATNPALEIAFLIRFIPEPTCSTSSNRCNKPKIKGFLETLFFPKSASFTNSVPGLNISTLSSKTSICITAPLSE